MNRIQFWLLFGFGALLIALALDVWLRMKQAREEAQKRVDAMMRRHLPEPEGGPMYGVPTLPVDKIEIPPLPFDRLRVTDELPEVTFAPTDDEIADWVNGRKRKQGA